MTLEELLKLFWQWENGIWLIEDNAAAAALAAYDVARQTLRAELEGTLDKWAQMGMPENEIQRAILARHEGIIAQIEYRIEELKQQLINILQPARSEVIEMTLEHYAAELNIGLGITFARFSPVVVEFALPTVIEEIDYYSEKIRRELIFHFRTFVLQGKGVDEVIRRLMSETLMPKSIWQRNRVGCEILARHVLLKAHNMAKQVAMTNTQMLVPEIRKQAVAVIDHRTTDCCLNIHGTIVNVDQSFNTDYGEFLFPPFHVRCRTTIVTWHGLLDPKGESTKAMRHAA